MKKLLMLTFCAALLAGAWSCQVEGDEVETFAKPTDVVNPNPPLPPVDFTKTSLGELAASQGILLGAAFTHDEYFQNDEIAEILARDFKAVTFGNEMKHDAIVGANGRMNFATADEMVQWTTDAGAQLFGHVLGWHSQQQTAYLNSLIDKASEDNSASIFQDNWDFEAGSLAPYAADNFVLADGIDEVFAGEGAAKAAGDGATLSFSAPVQAGTPYIVSFWAKGPEGATVALKSGDNQNAATDVSPSWYKYSVTVPTQSVGSFAYQLTASEGVIIDNIRVIEAVIEEDDNKSGNYINPHAIGGGMDFEGYVAGMTASQLLDAGFAQINGADYVSITNEYSNSGSLSLKMDNSDGHGANGWDIQVITPSFDVEAGKVYRIAWYARANESADLQIDIREDGSAKSYKNSAWGQYPKAGTDWTYQYVDYEVEAGSALSVGFYGATDKVCYYIDDFQIFEAIYEGDYTNYIDKTNILPGADFENADAWGIWNGSDNASFILRNDPEIDANKDYVHSALRALKVDNVGTGWTGGGAWHIQVANSNKVEVKAGESYRTAMWIKSPDGAETIQFELRYDDGTTGYKQLTGITDKWTYLYRDDVMPEGVAEIQLVLDCAYDEATYYIDDVQFFPTPVESCIDPGSVADDGDFEAYEDVAALQAAGWQVNGASYVSFVDDAHHGGRAIRMDNSADVAANAWDIQLVSKKYPVTGGKTYRVAWQAKADEDAVDMQIDIRFDVSSTSYKSSAYGNYDKMNTDWTYQFLDVEVAEGDSEIQIGFYGGASANVITIDCFQIFPVESAPAALKAARGSGKYGSGWIHPEGSKARPRVLAFDASDKFDGELPEAAIGAAYRNWIYAMIDHFDVYAWDVINETFTENGDFRTSKNTEAGDHIFLWGDWFGGGRAFVDKAFAYAQDAIKDSDSKPVLYINDYNLETSEAKRAAFCAYAKENDDVTGVGTQMHLDMSTPDLESKITASLTDLAATGKMVRISELDIKCTDQQAQADLYVYIFDQYLKLVPAAQRGGITIWGINDKDSWVGESNAPLLWSGAKYNKKPAYEALYIYLCELAGINPRAEVEE